MILSAIVMIGSYFAVNDQDKTGYSKGSAWSVLRNMSKSSHFSYISNMPVWASALSIASLAAIHVFVFQIVPDQWIVFAKGLTSRFVR
jgi:hypothetical protein